MQAAWCTERDSTDPTPTQLRPQGLSWMCRTYSGYRGLWTNLIVEFDGLAPTSRQHQTPGV